MKQNKIKLDFSQVLNYFPITIAWTIWLIVSIVLLCTSSIPLIVALLPLLIPLAFLLCTLLANELSNLITLILKNKGTSH